MGQQISFNKKWPVILSCMVIFILSYGIYLNALHNEFHFDDIHSIVENFSLQKLGNIPRFFIDTATFSGDQSMEMYRPVLMVTYALNYHFWGLEVTGYHLVNNLIHSLNAVLVFLITTALLYHQREQRESPGGEEGTLSWYRTLPPLFSGLLFGVHTLNSQAVNYISSRSVLLVTLFYLASFYLYIMARREGGGVKSLIAYGGAFIAYILSLLSKEVGITLPLMLLAYEYLFHRSDYRGYMKNFVRYQSLFWSPVVGYLIIRKVLFGKAVITLSWAAFWEGGGMVRSIYINILTQIKVTVIYLKLFLFPSNLSIDKVIQEIHTLLEPLLLLSLFIVGSLIAVAILLSKRERVASLGILWFFIALIPETILPLNLIYNEHRSYLPLVGLCAAFGAGISRIVYRLEDSTYRGGWKKGAVVLVLILPLMALSVATFERNKVWRTPLSFWSDVMRKNPFSYRSRLAIGRALNREGNHEEAVKYYLDAISLAPRKEDAYINMGITVTLLGRNLEAIAYFKKAIELNPEAYKAYNSIAIRYAMLNDYENSLAFIQKGLKMNPRYPYYYNTLGNILIDGFGRREEAIEAYRKAISLAPDWKLPKENLKRLF